MTAVSDIDDFIVLICDDVRLELNSKFSMMGYYVGNTVRVDDIGLFSTIPLAFVIVLINGEGFFDFKFEIFSPKNSRIIEGSAKIEKERGTPAAHIIKIAAFPVREEGKYELKFSVDNKKYENSSFLIIKDETLVPS